MPTASFQDDKAPPRSAWPPADHVTTENTGSRGSRAIGSRLLLWRLLTLMWAIHVSWMSSEIFGGAHTRGFLAALLVGVSPEIVDALNVILRKLAHLVEYAMLGLLLYQAFGGQERLRSRPELVAWCLGIAVLYALADEMHQAFVPGRGASWLDSCLDATGAAIAILAIHSWPFASWSRFRR